ncbi:hypothetical protein P3G55_09525 [Leptospira sp. 96542]|nr:hypothetical protein [Leptospira sp. 96542]
MSHSKGSWLLSTSCFFSKVGAHDANSKFENGFRPNWKFKTIQICKYYIVTIKNLIFFVLFKVLHSLARQKTKLPIKDKILIDSYVVIENLLRGQKILSDYMPNLIPVLDKEKLDYVILPRLYRGKSVFSVFRLFRQWRESKENVLTEYQLISFIDFFCILCAALVYPILMYYHFLFLKRHCSIDLRLEYFFWFDLNGSNFNGIVRYIFSKKLVKYLNNGMKIIQWYEGQIYEKCLNRAIRESDKFLTIYGCQLFIFPPELLNVYIDKNEFKHHLPDVVLVNGTYFLDKNPLFKVGPALRYSRLYESDSVRIVNQDHLVLLSYFSNNNNFILNLISKISIQQKEISWAIKAHPSCHFDPSNNHHIGSLNNFEITDKNLYELLPKHGFVIGSASGSLVEAIAFGNPVILAAEKNFIEYNYLPDFCKGMLWEVAYDVESFLNAKKKLTVVMEEYRELRMELVQRVKRELFNNPTEAQIINSFELNMK